jgi:hypothetical protein
LLGRTGHLLGARNKSLPIYECPHP